VSGLATAGVRLLFSCDGVFSAETRPLRVATSVAAVVFSKVPPSLAFQSSALVV
jgi:hypothetical protein